MAALWGGEVILLCVRWYCRYSISYRDLEEMMGERGGGVDHDQLLQLAVVTPPSLLPKETRHRQVKYLNNRLHGGKGYG